VTSPERPFIQELLEELLTQIEKEKIVDADQLQNLRTCIMDKKSFDSKNILGALFGSEESK